jgi:hypothetical protein
MSTAGLSDVVRYGRLRHRVEGHVVPYAPTLFDDELLTAVDAAASRWIPLAVILPMPATATAITLGAAATVSAIARVRRLDVTVAVVSKQLSHRALYDQLYLEEQRLREYIPRARFDGEGSVVPIGRAKNDSGGRLLLTSDLTRLLGMLDTLEAVVLDASAVPVSQLGPLLALPKAGTPLLYLTANPLDPALPGVRDAGGAVWSWDIDDLAPLSAPVVTARRAATAGDRRTAAAGRGSLTAPAPALVAASSTRRCIWLPDSAAPDTAAAAADSHALDDATAALWRAIAILANCYSPQRSALATGGPTSGQAAGPATRATLGAADLALRWIWAVFNTVALLPVDPARYDLLLPATPWATRLTSSADQARAYARNAPQHLTEPWLRVADALERTLTAAASAPKLGRVLSWVSALCEDAADDPLRHTGPDPSRAAATTHPHDSDGTAADPAGRALLVTRNRIAAAALTQVLEEHPATPLSWQDTVVVVSLSDVLTGRASTSDHMLLCGPIPRSAAGLLAMPATATVAVLAAGSWDGTRITKQMEAACTALSGLRTETVTLSAPMLGIAPHRTDLFGDEVKLTAVAGGQIQPLPAHPDAPQWEPFDADILAILTRLSSETAREDLPPPPVRTDAPDVDAIAIWLGPAASPTSPLNAGTPGSADSVVLLAADDLIRRRRGSQLSEVAAKSLIVGDVLVLVDDGARADLFTTITARLAELPAYTPLTALIDLWRARAAAARSTGLTYEQIWQRLTAAGSTITAVDTVGSWVRGQVDGPADPDDVARFAAAVGDDELAKMAKPISVAVRAVHTAHRKVGCWLSGQISGALDRDDPEQVVDVSLQVHVADLLDSVSLHPVATVDLAVRTVPAGLTGTALDAAAAAAYGIDP